MLLRRRIRVILSTVSIALLSTAAFAADAAVPPKPSAPPEPADMKPMFDGKTLEGWDGDPRLWSVKDGMIRGETTRDAKTTGNTFLIWKGGEPADFELRLSFRMDHGNSGVQYRSKYLPPEKKPQNNWVMTGYQAEIANLPGKDGFLYHEKGPNRGHAEHANYLALVGEKVEIDEHGKSHVVGSLGDRTAIGDTYKKSDWNDYVIIARGNHLQHYLNGIQTVDVIDKDSNAAASRGLIALQIHAGEPMVVEFKNIRLKQYDDSKSASEK
jgi:hypothetical protein